MATKLRAAWSCAALLTTAVLAACSGNDVLGPPDGTACTVGTIAPGDSVNGNVRGSSCQVFSEWTYAITSAQSWTLNAKKGTVYILRLRHQQDASANDHWKGDLTAYGRNPQGDATFVTGWWGSFGTNNGNGGKNEEMFIPADRDRTLSIRVVSTTLADTGAYSLVVSTCAMTPLADTTDHAGVDLSTGCPTFGVDALPTKTSFFTIRADSAVRDTVNVTRTAGTGYIRADFYGTDMDVNCWNSDCTGTSSSWTTATTLTAVPSLPGMMTLMTSVHADSAATVTVNTRPTPLAATAVTPAPTFARVVGPANRSR